MSQKTTELSPSLPNFQSQRRTRMSTKAGPRSASTFEFVSIICIQAKQLRRAPILVSPDFQDETLIETKKIQKKSWRDKSRPVATKAGLNIGQKEAQKQCFNKSKRVQKGPNWYLYETIWDFTRPYETRSRLSLNRSHRRYLIETYWLLGLVSFTLSRLFFGVSSRLGLWRSRIVVHKYPFGGIAKKMPLLSMP